MERFLETGKNEQKLILGLAPSHRADLRDCLRKASMYSGGCRGDFGSCCLCFSSFPVLFSLCEKVITGKTLQQSGVSALNWQPIQVWSAEPPFSSVVLRVKLVCLTFPLCADLFKYISILEAAAVTTFFWATFPLVHKTKVTLPYGVFFSPLCVIDYSASVVPIKFPQTDSIASIWQLTRRSLRDALKSVLTISNPVLHTTSPVGFRSPGD